MSRLRRREDPQSGLTGSTSRPNRLSRTFRQTQQTAAELEPGPPRSQQTDFKTPTRIPRSRAGGGVSAESPHNDSDLQQDIIWDATSPSPNRLGKRGKKQPAGVVNISEIVSRIAPKYGRPKAAEPTLQQWIGDSATIPCTPDVQAPKPKKKSPRPNGVDDLLKLAKQFDFNMFHQDEEEEEEEVEEGLRQQSLELLPEDVLDQSHFSPPPPGHRPPAVEADVQMSQHNDDDLDFLFDGPTQHVSGNLSQALQVRAAPGIQSSSHGSSSSTNSKAALGNDVFEDDWDNDDLLNDSLLLEMTQNPQNFAAPRHSSTQKPSSDMKYQRQSPVPVSVGAGFSQSAASKVDSVRQRTTFKLESNPNFSVKRLQANSKDHSSAAADENRPQDRSSSSKSVSVQAGSQSVFQASNSVTSDPQKTRLPRRTSVLDSTVSETSAPQTAFPRRPAVVSSHQDSAAVFQLLDDDLDSFFSSDPVWDDPADDHLLCELCEDVENQIQRAANVPTERPTADQNEARRSRKQPANQQLFPAKQTPALPACAAGTPAVSPSAAGFISEAAAGLQVNATTDSFRFTQTKNTSGYGSTCVQGGRGVPSAPQGHARKDQFTFKKPHNPVSTAGSKVVGKCSAAEIELKKQQALERRRRRLQAAQNLRAPPDGGPPARGPPASST